MKLNHFQLFATTIPDSWFQCCYNIFHWGNKYKIDRGSFEGSERLEFDSVSIQIDTPGIKPLIPEFPPWMNCPPPVTQEYLDSYFVQLLSSDIPENTTYSYGEYISYQIHEIAKMLKKTPHTNQACITIGDKKNIWMEDPPCMKVLQFKIIENKLIAYVYFRSNDLYAGYPCNIAGIQMLKEFVAYQMETEVEDGPIFYYGSGLHLYDYQFEIVKRRIMNNESC